MGLFRIILGAGDRDDDGGPPAGVSRGTVHGSHHKAALNRLTKSLAVSPRSARTI